MGGDYRTSGCIGLKSRKDMKQLKNILIRSQKKGQQKILIEVKYK